MIFAIFAALSLTGMAAVLYTAIVAGVSLELGIGFFGAALAFIGSLLGIFPNRSIDVNNEKVKE